MKTKELKEIVKSFRNGILKRRSVKMKCFMVCSPLSSYLNIIGVKNEMIKGCVFDHDEAYNHYWIEFGKRIIDPTYSQFLKARKGIDIFIGIRPKWYHESRYL